MIYTEKMHNNGLDSLGVLEQDGPQSIVDLVFHNSRRKAATPAIEWLSGKLTYGDLAPLVLRTAFHLRSLGVGVGDPVAIALGDHVDHLVSLLAVATLGAVILPIDVRWTEKEKAAVAHSFGAVLALIDDGAAPVADLTNSATDEAWHRSIAAAPLDFDLFVRGRSRPLALSLSSGTTGRPKGPLATHGQILNRLYIYTGSLGFRDTDRFMVASPLYFGGARYMSLAYLCLGGTLVLYPPPYSPRDFIDAMQQRDITSLFLVPTILRRLLEIPFEGEIMFPQLRRLVSSGAVLHADERRAVKQKICSNFMNFYSSTEGGGVSVLDANAPDELSGSIGRVVLGAEVEIVDDQHKPVATGSTGRIRYRGGSVAAGYHLDPEASKEAFRDGWYYPGDLAHFDTDGFLFLDGRAKDMIIRGGVNIYPNEIEEVLMRHAEVRDAAVTAMTSAELGEEVVAFVVLHRPLNQHQLLEYCRLQLAPYKVPKLIVQVDELPRNSSGKVLKAKLLELLGRQP